MPTIRQAFEKVSELRSRIAVSETLMVYLESNYLDSDAGEAEMTITREDAALVSQGHISAYIQSLADDIDQAKSELAEWESMPLSPTLAEPAEEATTPPKIGTRKGKKAARERNEATG